PRAQERRSGARRRARRGRSVEDPLQRYGGPRNRHPRIGCRGPRCAFAAVRARPRTPFEPRLTAPNSRGTTRKTKPMLTVDQEKQFKTALDGARSNQEKLLANFDRLDRDTKKLFDDLTVQKNRSDQSDAALTCIQRTLLKIQAALTRESRTAFGD